MAEKSETDEEPFVHPIGEAEDADPINFKQELANHLKGDEYVGSHQEPDTSIFRASSAGYCKRQMLLNKMGVKENDAQGLGRFQVGDMIHEYIQSNILPNHMTTHEKQVVYEQDGITLKGHYDCFDGDIVYDFKSRSSWYRYDPPIQRHLDQLNVYMAALGIDYGMMVYVCKKDLTVESFPDFFDETEEREDIDESQFLVEFSQDRLDHVIKKCRDIKKYLDENGYPGSKDEIPWDKCGDKNKDQCMGCRFEGKDKINFDRFIGTDNSDGKFVTRKE